MPTLLQLNDVASLRSPKILYVGTENCITVYFFSNSSNLNAKQIKQKFKENTFKLAPSACLSQIGEILTTDRNWLSHVEVDSRYQKMGIGSRLIQLAIKHLHLDYIACVKENQAYSCCLTEAGEQLIVSCIKNGYIKASMCIFEGHASLFSENATNDPGQQSFAIANALSAIRLPPIKKRKLSADTNTLRLKLSTQQNSININLLSNIFSPIRPYLKLCEKKSLNTPSLDLEDEFTDIDHAIQNTDFFISNCYA